MKQIVILFLTCSVCFGQKVTDGKFVVVNNRVDMNNNTTVALPANTNFTGAATDLSSFGAISLIVKTDAPSASKGFLIQYSPDGSDWHTGEAYTVPSNSEKFYTPPVWSRYYRVVYSNGAVANTNFAIHSFAI